MSQAVTVRVAGEADVAVLADIGQSSFRAAYESDFQLGRRTYNDLLMWLPVRG